MKALLPTCALVLALAALAACAPSRMTQAEVDAVDLPAPPELERVRPLAETWLASRLAYAEVSHPSEWRRALWYTSGDPIVSWEYEMWVSAETTAGGMTRPRPWSLYVLGNRVVATGEPSGTGRLTVPLLDPVVIPTVSGGGP